MTSTTPCLLSNPLVRYLVSKTNFKHSAFHCSLSDSQFICLCLFQRECFNVACQNWKDARIDYFTFQTTVHVALEPSIQVYQKLLKQVKFFVLFQRLDCLKRVSVCWARYTKLSVLEMSSPPIYLNRRSLRYSRFGV